MTRIICKVVVSHIYSDLSNVKHNIYLFNLFTHAFKTILAVYLRLLRIPKITLSTSFFQNFMIPASVDCHVPSWHIPHLSAHAQFRYIDRFDIFDEGTDQIFGLPPRSCGS